MAHLKKTKEKIGIANSISLKGKKHTELHKENQSIAQLERYRKMTLDKKKEIKDNIQTAWKNKSKKEIDEFRKKISSIVTLQHKNMSQEQKSLIAKDLRNARIKQIENQYNNNQPIHPNIGKHEMSILDNIEKERSIKIIRQYKIIGYFLDGYCKETNEAFEIDESHHFNLEGNLYSYDIQRQQEIENELNCKFIRIKSIMDY